MENQKTYKREVAFSMLVFLVVLFMWGVLGNPTALIAANTLVFPVFALVTAAFGYDAHLKGRK